MPFGWGEHVGELELSIEAATEDAVFVEAVNAIAELLADGEPGPLEWREVSVEGTERAVLLAEWLAELAYLAETEGFVPAAVERLALEPDLVRARLGGRRGSPPHLIKAVTYHGLRFEPAPGGWRAHLVMDV
jgi:SHS2 domain-containing protein